MCILGLFLHAQEWHVDDKRDARQGGRHEDFQQGEMLSRRVHVTMHVQSLLNCSHSHSTQCTIRVRLPDHTDVEASFGARESLLSVHRFVATCLRRRRVRFHLCTQAVDVCLCVRRTVL
jgi:hypothetical protein